MKHVHKFAKAKRQPASSDVGIRHSDFTFGDWSRPVSTVDCSGWLTQLRRITHEYKVIEGDGGSQTLNMK